MIIIVNCKHRDFRPRYQTSGPDSILPVAMFVLRIMGRLLMLLALVADGQAHKKCRPRNCAQADCYGVDTEDGPTFLYPDGNKQINASCEVYTL